VAIGPARDGTPAKPGFLRQKAAKNAPKLFEKSNCSPSGAVNFVLAALYGYDDAIGEAAYAPAGTVNFSLRDTQLVCAGG
jgi:hypothetical protein